jgi:Xaa-Pro dipeptidase
MYRNPFSDREIENRQVQMRAALAGQGLAGAVFAAPETVFWLTGLDHWGYFAPHLLIMPVDGRAILVTRAMERVTIEHQVKSAEFRGHSDDVTAASAVAQVISEIGLAGAPLGLEEWTAGLSHGLGTALKERTDALWRDVQAPLSTAYA